MSEPFPHPVDDVDEAPFASSDDIEEPTMVDAVLWFGSVGPSDV